MRLNGSMASKGGVIFMSYKPKTNCFAYRKMYGCESCIALTSLYCMLDKKCAFYKPIKQIKDENTKEKKDDQY